MSRVDEALRRAAGQRVGVAPTPAAPPTPAIDQFRREDPISHLVGRGDPPPLRPVESRPAPEPPRTPRWHPEPDETGRARLVSTGANRVSLEQYRRLAATLHDEQAEGPLTTIMVTSALPGEGKTLTLANLALTLAESYARNVLAIDADLRWPTLHTTLGIPNHAGLSDALQHPTGRLPIGQVSRHLSVLTAGESGDDPLACLTSPRMDALLQTCAAEYDWVLLDASPVGVLSDAQVLARLVEGVVLVIGAGTTPAAAVERAVVQLGGPDAIIGAVLNRVETHRIPDVGYYGRYGGGSGHGP